MNKHYFCTDCGSADGCEHDHDLDTLEDLVIKALDKAEVGLQVVQDLEPHPEFRLAQNIDYLCLDDTDPDWYSPTDEGHRDE